MNLTEFWKKVIGPDRAAEELAHPEHWTREILAIMCVVMSAFTLVMLIGALFGLPPDGLVITLGADVLVALGYFLARTGHWKLARFIPPILFFGLGIYGSVINGLATAMVLFYVISFLLVSMFFGDRALGWMVLLTIITHITLGSITDKPSLEDIIIVSITFTVTQVGLALLFYYFTHQFRLALNHSIQSYRQLHEEITNRKLVENSLIERETQLHILADHMLDLVYQLDVEGNYVYISPSHHSVLGYDPEKLLGSSAYALIHPEDLPRVQTWVRQSLSIAVNKSEELRLRHAGGHYIWMSVNGTVQRTIEGEFTGFVMGARDITTRKEAEEKLRLSEDKFFKAFHTAPDGLLITRLEDGLIVEVNQGFSIITGFSTLELVGHTTAELNLYVNSTHRDELVHQLQRNGEYLNIELFVRHKAGHTGTVLVSGRLIEIRGERYILNIVRDVTESKQAEQALRESETRFRNLAQNFPDHIYLLDIIHHRLDYYNRQTFLGYNRSVLESATSLLAYTHPEDIAQVAAHWQQVKEGSTPPTLEYRLINADGNWEWLQTREIILSRNEDGKPASLMVIISVITERKNTESAMLRSAEKIRAMYESITDGVTFSDFSGAITECNTSAVRLHGFDSPTEMIGLYAIDLFAPENREQVLQVLQESYTSGRAALIEFPLLRKDGTRFDGEISTVLLRNEHGEPAGLVGFTRDISQRKQAELALRDSESKFRSIVESSPVGMHMYTFEEEGRLVFAGANPAADRILGVDHTQFIGKTIEQAFPSLAGTEVPERYRLACSRGDTWFTQQINYQDQQVQGAFEVHAFQTSPNHMVASFLEVTERIRSEVELKRLNRALSTISECNQALVRAQNEQELFDAICHVIVEHGGYRMAWIGTVDNAPEQMITPAAFAGYESGYLQHLQLNWLDQSVGPTARALHSQMPVVTTDIAKDPEFIWSSEALERGYAAAICFPLHFDGQLFGNLNIYSDQVGFFDANEIALLGEMAGDLAFGIQTLRVRNQRVQAEERVQQASIELATAYDATLEGWANALEMRERETAGHSRRVVELTLKMSHLMGLPETDSDHIRRGALLHDIGKMGIPDSILLKPGPLSDEEWVIMRQHPIYAYNLLKDIPYLQPALDIPYCHHERWDGSGYPRGLKGEQIPLAARIFAVIDVLDALTSNRPYRPAWNQKSAIQYLMDQAGKQFDPQVVAAFSKLQQFTEGG